MRNQSDEEQDSQSIDDFFKAAWIATVYNLDYPSKAIKDSSILKRDIDNIVSIACESGLDALFFQVRPSADAFYKSDIFPWSKYLTGQQGLAPDNGFDPLEYIIQKCHKVGLQLHAWINPFRVTALATDKLIASHPAKLFPELTFKVNGKTYFNPGKLQAIDLIVSGTLEIAKNYDIDGIHFDDYFYPEGITTEDHQTFAENNNGFANISDWRRNNIDFLIENTYQALKEVDSDILFGVSPSGIWANKSSNPLGSDTRGFESYYAIYADSRGWVKKGFVDYIAPQIYWYIGQNGSDFLTVLKWWSNVCVDTEVALAVGLAGYKQDEDWRNRNEIEKQVEIAHDYADGIVIFAFSDLSKENIKNAINI